MSSLEGKSALVTGAGRGIGEATARKLAACGARVLVNDLDADVAEAVAASIPGAVAFPADLTDPAAADAVVGAALEAFGGLDIVVNNAGYIWHSAIHNMSDEQWDAMLDIHASAQFRILRAYGRWLRQNASADSPTRKVVNISSTMGVHGGATQLAYSAGKAEARPQLGSARAGVGRGLLCGVGDPNLDPEGAEPSRNYSGSVPKLPRGGGCRFKRRSNAGQTQALY